MNLSVSGVRFVLRKVKGGGERNVGRGHNERRSTRDVRKEVLDGDSIWTLKMPYRAVCLEMELFR